MLNIDDPWDGRDWYYWDTVSKSGQLVADALWALQHPVDSSAKHMTSVTSSNTKEDSKS